MFELFEINCTIFINISSSRIKESISRDYFCITFCSDLTCKDIKCYNTNLQCLAKAKTEKINILITITMSGLIGLLLDISHSKTGF